MNQPAGHCIVGNQCGDEYCQRDRKLNLRATSDCIRKGCLSAAYVENHTLVCAHTGPCECIDRLGNTYGDITRTRSIAEVLDAEKSNEALRIVSLLKQQRHETVSAGGQRS